VSRCSVLDVFQVPKFFSVIFLYIIYGLLIEPYIDKEKYPFVFIFLLLSIQQSKVCTLVRCAKICQEFWGN
jgi:hypothetical protein